MDFLFHFLPAVERLGTLGYWLAFAVSFLESLAVVGAFVPGTTVVVIFGVFTAQQYYDFPDLVWFIAIGAILGDVASYWLGTKGTGFFKNENKILKLSHIERGKDFFAKHGDKSVFIGRLIGPLRPIVPFVAGLSGMNTRVFLFWNVVSGFVWAVLFLSLGYFFGASLALLNLWSKRAEVFFIIVAVLIFMSWCIGRWGYFLWRFIPTSEGQNKKVL